MNFLFILLAVAIIALKAAGYLKGLSWTLAIALSAGLLFVNFFKDRLSEIFLLGSNTGDPDAKDSCGCGPGQLAVVRKRTLFGSRLLGAMPCQQYLNLTPARKYSIASCTN